MTLRSFGKYLAPPLALLALTGAYFHGDRLSIVFPDGWSAPVESEKGLFVSKEADPGANCNAQTSDLTGLAKSTLADINADYGHVFAAADWADLLGVKPEQVTVVTSELRPFADAYFHVATLQLKIDTKDITTRYGFYALPGRVSMAGCYAASAEYAAHKALFEKTIDSFRPW